MLKVGIIGFGVQGSFYARLIQKEKRVEDLSVCAICDVDSERIRLAQELYPDIPTYDNAETLLENAKCDFVIVAIPHYSHPSVVMSALSKGVPVMNEKPSGVYARQVREMNE